MNRIKLCICVEETQFDLTGGVNFLVLAKLTIKSSKREVKRGEYNPKNQLLSNMSLIGLLNVHQHF